MRVLILVFIFLFTGCYREVKPPEWYLNPPEENGFIYASGTGKNKEEAINSALNSLASKISVNISSKFVLFKEYTNQNGTAAVYKKLTKEITSSVKNISFFDYKICKIKKIEGKYYALLKIDRIKNAVFICNDVKNYLKSLNIEKNDKIEILRTYPEIIKMLNLQLYKSEIASLLGKRCESEKILTLKKLLQERLNNIGVEVESKMFYPLLKDVFTRLNIPLKKGIKIYVNKKILRKKIAGSYIVELKLKIELKDKSEKYLNVACAGRSVTDFSTAYEFSLKECRRKLINLFSDFFNVKTPYQ